MTYVLIVMWTFNAAGWTAEFDDLAACQKAQAYVEVTALGRPKTVCLPKGTRK